MKNDVVCTIGNSVIQHGKLNDRVYLMKLSPDDIPVIVAEMIDGIAEKYGYSKSFAKVHGDAADIFAENGYKTEAVVPGFFSGKSDGYFISKYYRPERGEIEESCKDEIERILGDTEKIRDTGTPDKDRKDPGIRIAGEEDADALAELYGRVFESYPFPIHDPGYIRETMNENISYFGIWEDDMLLAASSCETDISGQNVEMTDFAVSPECRGKGYAGLLLDAMENEMKKDGFITSYTIARAAHEPVNRLFARSGYSYCGTLKNNTNICGSFESMNVWYKKID
ncbi:putative beta-lysine N-acetyltransferase [Methanolacinia paynteri]|uniref:putative beta-lysine N-acetyltransferase n=1 Tax=Methanolacinia paynteri TaxID=230356 RepID=UPI00064F37E3|nr:putative beta-lysine N-acetyltransferase [Methanolacinia paynteri]